MKYTTPYLSIVLMGKIASGKGTQARSIIDRFGGHFYSNGDKVRETVTKDSTFGQKMKEVYEAGLLIPEWIAEYWMTHALVAEYPNDVIVFEAVAKKPDEAKLFHEIHQWLDRPYIVFNLHVSDDVVYERSRARARDVVDEDVTIKRRLQQFNEHTQKSIEYFRSAGTLHDIDGALSLDEVQEIIYKKLTNEA